jgi:hypothetical protein
MNDHAEWLPGYAEYLELLPNRFQDPVNSSGWKHRLDGQPSSAKDRIAYKLLILFHQASKCGSLLTETLGHAIVCAV